MSIVVRNGQLCDPRPWWRPKVRNFRRFQGSTPSYPFLDTIGRPGPRVLVLSHSKKKMRPDLNAPAGPEGAKTLVFSQFGMARFVTFGLGRTRRCKISEGFISAIEVVHLLTHRWPGGAREFSCRADSGNKAPRF